VQVVFDGGCFGCGADNPDGLQMKFEPSEGASVCELEVPPRFQSWAGMIHGGVVALMLDEAVGWAAWHAGHPGVTGRMELKFLQPLKIGDRVRVSGRVEGVRRTLVYTSALIERLSDGARLAEATATLMAAGEVELKARR
jgi:acyl-coenzyme A thioesterase PaaI-like protein